MTEDGKPTNEGDGTGAETDTPVEGGTSTSKLLTDAAALVTRQEAANKDTKEILKRQEFLKANEMLGGTAGGHVDTPNLSEEDKKKANALEFFKGTALGDAIYKTK